MRNATWFTFVATALITLSSCAVGPDYETPALPLPAEYTARIPAGVDILHSPGSRWWQHFNDPTLNQLIIEGTRANLDVQVAIARVNEARALAGEAKLGLFPEATLQGSYTEGKFGTATNPFFENADRDFRAFRGSVLVNWEIDLFGRIRRLIEQRSASSEALEAALADVILSVQAEIANSYLLMRAAAVELAVIRQNARKQKESVAITRALFDSGAAGELDLARAKSQFFRTRSEIPLVEARLHNAQYRIAVLLGRPPEELPSYLSDPGSIPVYTGPIHVESPANLIRRRPDIREAERHLAAATADIGVETAEYFPQISIIGDFGFEARHLSDLGEQNSDAFSYGPAITWRILNARRTMRRVAAADERAKQALHVYQQTIFLALEDVENALTEFRTARIHLARIEVATRQSARAAEISQVQYRAGTLDFLDVLAADRSKLELEQQRTLSETRVQQSYVQLYKAFGGGWGPIAALPASETTAAEDMTAPQQAPGS